MAIKKKQKKKLEMIWCRIGGGLMEGWGLVGTRGRGRGDQVAVSWLGLQRLRLVVPLVVIRIRLRHRLLE